MTTLSIVPSPDRSVLSAETLAAQLRAAPDRFAQPQDAQVFLKDAGLSITGAILVTRLAYGLSMGEAKAIVSAHAAWSREARAGDALHRDLQRMVSAHPGLKSLARGPAHPA